MISSQDFPDVIASVIKVCVKPFDLPWASFVPLSVVRSAAVSMSTNQSYSSVASCPVKMDISCSKEFVKFVCFCTKHRVFMSCFKNFPRLPFLSLNSLMQVIWFPSNSCYSSGIGILYIFKMSCIIRVKVLQNFNICIYNWLFFSGHVSDFIQGLSQASMVGSHSMCFIGITIDLVSVSYPSQYCFKLGMQSKVVAGWHEQLNKKIVDSLTRQRWCEACCMVVTFTVWLMAWNFTV